VRSALRKWEKQIYLFPSPSLRDTTRPLCGDASSLHAALLNGDCFHAHNKMDRPGTSISCIYTPASGGIELGLESIAPYLQRNAAREPFFSTLSKSSFTKRRQAHYFPSDGIEFHSKSTSTSGTNNYLENICINVLIVILTCKELKFAF
jgi:hypothetical protein